MITITELYERLKKIDEISLLEMLEISSEDIVDRFQDKIDLKYDLLLEEYNNEEENDDSE